MLGQMSMHLGQVRDARGKVVSDKGTSFAMECEWTVGMRMDKEGIKEGEELKREEEVAGRGGGLTDWAMLPPAVREILQRLVDTLQHPRQAQERRRILHDENGRRVEQEIGEGLFEDDQ